MFEALNDMQKKDLIRRYRESFKLTQADMARALGMSTRGYQDLENRETEVKRFHWLAIEYVVIRLLQGYTLDQICEKQN